MNRRFYPLSVLVLSLVSAYLCAAALVFTVKPRMQQEALEIGPSFYRTLVGPGIWQLAFRVATMVGLFVYLVAFYCLRERSLARSLPLVLGGTLCYIAGVAWFSPLLSLAGSPIVAVVLLTYCRSTKAVFFRGRGQRV